MLILYLLLTGLLLALRIWGGPLVHAELRAPADAFAIAAIGFLIAIVSALALDRLLRRLYWTGYFKPKQGYEAPALLRDLATALIFAITVSAWLYVDLDFSAAGLLAASGATAVVIGLALQTMILDLFSGLSINLDRSYEIGDWLTVKSGEAAEPIYGKVEGMTWRCTVLQLEDGRSIFLPNHLVTANALINHSRPKIPKRLSVEIGLDIRIPAERARRTLLGEAFKAAQATGLHVDPAPSVLLDRLDSDACYYQVRFYSDPQLISPSEARSVMLSALHGAVAREGLPAPVQQVELSEAPEPFSDEVALRDALGRVPLFARTLSAEQIDRLAAASAPRTLPPAAALMRQGAAESSMFVILEGAAQVSVSGDGAAAARPVAVLAGGDIVGEMSVMTGAPRSATVTALTALRVLEITKDRIEAIFADAPELLERFSVILAEREAGLKAQASQAVRWDFVQRDLLGRMRSFFSRAFGSGGDTRPG